MSFEDKYLIVSDLDGTFFGINSSILPRNINAIRAFQDKGGMFTVATGRSEAILRVIFPTVADVVSGPAVLSGGACLYDYRAGKVLDRRDHDKDLIKTIIRETRERFPDAGYRICTDKGFLTDHMTPHLSSRLKIFSDVTTVDDLDRHLDLIWYKLTYDVPPEDKPALKAYLDGYSPKVNVSGSSPCLSEILNADASKGRQIGNLRKLYPGRTIVCVGDYDNDLDMLLAADLAACPANANENVKAVSSLHLCENNEGCIADLIEQLQKQK